MKQSLMLYLLIIAVLFNLFTYVFMNNKVKFEQERYEKVSAKLKDSLNSVTNKWKEADYFSLANNENAQNYFENFSDTKTLKYEEIIPYVTEKLLDYNSNPKGNPFTGQEQMGDNKFVINKVKVLNHRWIIADFSDGTMWGEVLLKYFINDDNSVSFEVNQSLLYQN